jgi:hypothetical protein
VLHVRVALFIVACIVVANLAFVVYLTLRYFIHRRRRRREIDGLEALMQPSFRGPSRRGRAVGGSTVVAAMVVLVSGVEMATPEIRDAVISTVDGAVDAVIEGREVDAAGAEETPSPSFTIDRSGSATTGPPPGDHASGHGDGTTGRNEAEDGAPADASPSVPP